jgi:glyoxylase-like metal-dependent hydrolase (beta-lactamase superfamily II)
LKPDDVKPKIVLFTHIHHDHTSGLHALENDIVIIMDKNEPKGIPKFFVSRHFKNKNNIKYLDFDSSINLFPFDKVLDIFGDCSILAISTRGHTAGHVSYLINDSIQPLLIVGDAIMNQEALELGIESFAIGKKAKIMVKESHRRIEGFLSNNPKVKIVYTHD